MKVVTTAQMRTLESRAIAEFGCTGESLMDRAGSGVADVVNFVGNMSGYTARPVHLFAGRGNNGGDAFVAARHLKEMDIDACVWIAADVGSITGDAAAHFNMMKKAGVTFHEAATPDDWAAIRADFYDEGGIIVDGILGTGLRGPARGPAAAAIQCINAVAANNLVVSIDVPSGLDSDTGRASGDVVTADVTATMGLPKPGLIAPHAVELIGSLEVVDIGLPGELTAPLASDVELVCAHELKSLLPRRSRNSHKGTYGHALLIGGSPGYAGAIALAARAAVRSGVGLVSVLAPESVAAIVAGLVPEAMVHAGRQTDTGCLADDAIARSGLAFDAFTAVMAGPGLGANDTTRAFVAALIGRSAVPLVLDADALNVMAGSPAPLTGCRAPVALTPHPGEMARLLGTTTASIQTDRFGAVRAAAEKTGATIVLKGAGTLIAAPREPVHVNMCGNPGMACGGMGDVLAGLFAGLAAQGLRLVDAARVAVYLHGRAADCAAWRTSQAGLTAGDVIGELPHTYREITAR